MAKAKKKPAKKTTQKPAQKAASGKQYRVTLICNAAGGPVKAENVGLAFDCPSCKGEIEVDKSYTALKKGDVNHSLRQVTEITKG